MNLSIRLKGKLAVVSGAASGIGAATCTRLVQEGAEVMLLDIDEARAKAVADEIGGQAIGLDVTDHQACLRVAAKVAEEYRAAQVLVNCAGWDRMMPFLETTLEFWDKVVQINLYGPMNLIKAFAPQMVGAGYGRIVNVASDAGRVGSSGESVYSAAKGGVVALTKTLARELARHGVTCNAVCPGPTQTPLLAAIAGEGEAADRIVSAMQKAIPLRRLASPDDIAAAIAYFASDDAAYVTGQTLSVSGGLTMS